MVFLKITSFLFSLIFLMLIFRGVVNADSNDLDNQIKESRALYHKANAVIGKTKVVSYENYTILNDFVKNRGLAKAEGIRDAIKELIHFRDVTKDMDNFSEVISALRREEKILKAEDARLEIVKDNPKINPEQRTQIIKSKLEPLHQRLSKIASQLETMDIMYRAYINPATKQNIIMALIPNAIIEAKRNLVDFNDAVNETFPAVAKPENVPAVAKKPIRRTDPAGNVLHAAPEVPALADPAPVARKKVFGNKGPMPDLARKIGKTSNVLGYVPLPSTLRAVWKDLSDAATGKTPQNYIKEHEASIRDANARIALIDKKITALENEIREISDRNKKTPAPYFADRRPFLEKQIRILEAQRGALEENIRQLQEGIIEESAKQLDTINKPYVDRSNPVQT